jgi:WD40 repeat protein
MVPQSLPLKLQRIPADRFVLLKLLAAAWLILAVVLLAPSYAGDKQPSNPSPLDKLDPSKIAASDRFAGQPKELVGVLALPRGRNRPWVLCVAFSQDGKWMAAGGQDKLVHLWSTEPTRKVAALKGHTDWVQSLAFAPNGKVLASASDDGTVRLWAVEGSKSGSRAAFKAHRGVFGGEAKKVTTVAFSPDSKSLATGGEDEIVRLWDLTNKKPEEENTLLGHTGNVLSVAFSSDKKMLASCGWDRKVRLWDLGGRKAKEKQTIEAENLILHSVAFSPDSKTLAIGDGDEPVLWDLTADKPKQRMKLKGHTKTVESLAFAPDGKTLVSAGFDRRIILWDARNGKELAMWRLPCNIRGIAFAPDGRHIATANENGTVYIFRLPKKS